MKRIRRVSIELIRREFNLSVTRPVVAGAEARPDDAGQDDRGMQQDPFQPVQCQVCASPWFALSLGDGEKPHIVQMALGKHGIHTQLSSTGELFVCRSSFELHTGAFKDFES